MNNMSDLVNRVMNIIISRLFNQQSIRNQVASMMPSLMDIVWAIHQELFTVETKDGKPHIIPKLPGIYEKWKKEMDDTPIIPPRSPIIGPIRRRE
jgi:hypothetical protein